MWIQFRILFLIFLGNLDILKNVLFLFSLSVTPINPEDCAVMKDSRAFTAYHVIDLWHSLTPSWLIFPFAVENSVCSSLWGCVTTAQAVEVKVKTRQRK